MLSDEQLIERIRTELRSELADLNPPPDLLDRLLEPAENDGRSQPGSGKRSPRRDWRRWRARVGGLGAAVPVLAAVIMVVVVAAVALTSLRPHHGSTGAGIATRNGKIAFVSGGSLEFANPDGSGLRHVGTVPHQCAAVAGFTSGVGCFAWSPDGTQFAYLAGGSHELTLYLVGADGQHPRPLTACGDCHGVSWSPDGSRIAVWRYLAGRLNVWVVNAKTGAMRPITDFQCTNGLPFCGKPGLELLWIFQLQWSPNGQRISFIYAGSKGTVVTSGHRRIVFHGSDLTTIGTVRPDGSDLTELNNILSPGAAQWSPDGRELAVTNGYSVYIVHADRTVTTLPKSPYQASVYPSIAWSPDGRELAIAPQYGGIYTVDADGKHLTRLAAGSVWAPAWSPDGTKLAYAATPGGVGRELWTINAAGSDRRLIYTTSAEIGVSPGSVPAWSPDGRQLAFSSIAGMYVVNANGSDLHRIGQGSRGAFAWQPVPSTR